MDKARKQTDKRLSDLERRIEKVYTDSPALRRIQKKYKTYMDNVEKATRGSYLAFRDETDVEHRQELKKAYISQIEAMTLKSKAHKKLIDEFTSIMAEVNQQALDLVNAEMAGIYQINYNQVAETCEEVGITVNDEAGETEST